MSLSISIVLSAACALLLGVLLGRAWASRKTSPSAVVTTPAPTATETGVDAAQRERERIYRDIHDDIGSKLLTLLHTQDDPQQADFVRGIMQDLRDVVSRSQYAGGSLREVLAQIRDETEQRLAALDIDLVWEISDALPDPKLADAAALHLFRISREAISNAVRHGDAHRIRVRALAHANILHLDFTDDGPGMPLSKPAHAGAGTNNIRSRAQALHGQVDWTMGTQGGTKIVLEFPLPPPE